MERKFEDIVERMILIRKLLGMTRKELADKIGYSASDGPKSREWRQDALRRLF